MRYCKETQRYGRWELICDAGEREIQITAPSGMLETVQIFLRQPGVFQWDHHGYETIKPSGEACLCARYTPREAGTYSFVTSSGSAGTFTAAEVGNHGYVEVGRKDARYFAFSDGTPFPIIGVNLAMATEYTLSGNQEFCLTDNRGYLGIRQYERWFQKLHAAGANHTRIWLGQEYLCPDTEDPMVLNLLQFEKLDAILELARKYGIYLKLTFEQFRFFGESRYGDAYDARCKRLFGKQFATEDRRCTSMEEWLREDFWRNCWIQKIRQYLLRYAGDPMVMVFELWNEMNAVEADYDNVIAWNRDMARIMRPMAPHNMWSQSLGSMDAEGNIEIYTKFPFEEFSFSQFHRYIDQGAPLEECRQDGFVLNRTGIPHASVPGMPVLLAETGAVNDCHSGPFRYYAADDRGIIFADTALPTFFLGAAGCGQMWHWEQYVENKKLFGLLRPLSEALTGVMLEEEAFQSIDLSDDSIWSAVLVGKHTVLGFVRNKQDSWYRVLRDGIEPEPIPSTLLTLDAPGVLSVYPIWQEELAERYLYDGKLEIRGLKYGLIFRIDRD